MNETSSPALPGRFVAWCLDPGSFLQTSGTHQYEITDTPFTNSFGLTAGGRDRVQRVFDANFASVDVANGVQAAGWLLPGGLGALGFAAARRQRRKAAWEGPDPDLTTPRGGRITFAPLCVAGRRPSFPDQRQFRPGPRASTGPATGSPLGCNRKPQATQTLSPAGKRWYDPCPVVGLLPVALCGVMS